MIEPNPAAADDAVVLTITLSEPAQQPANIRIFVGGADYGGPQIPAGQTQAQLQLIATDFPLGETEVTATWNGVTVQTTFTRTA